MRAGSHVKLSYVSIRQLGRGERRYTEIDELTSAERVYSPMAVTVQVEVEAQSQSAPAAMILAETLRIGLNGTAANDLLDVAEVGLASVGPARHVPYVDAHGRRRQVSLFELTCNAHLTVSTGDIGAARYVVVNTQEIPEIELSLPLYTEDGQALLDSVGDPLQTEGA